MTSMRDLVITDLLPQKGNENGLSPFLVGPVSVEESAGAKFEFEYQIGPDQWTKSPSDYKQVIGIRIKQIQGLGVIEVGQTVRFIIPMQVPSLTLKVDENNQPILDHEGEPQYENLDRFDFDNLFAKNIFKTNDGHQSKEVNIELDKKTFMHFYKIWQREEGDDKGNFTINTLPDGPTSYVKFIIKQIAKEEGKDSVVNDNYKLVYLNRQNKWNAVISGLPTEYKASKYDVDENGNRTLIQEKLITYTYEVQEVPSYQTGWAQNGPVIHKLVTNASGKVGDSYWIHNIDNRIKLVAKKHWEGGQAVRPKKLILGLIQDGKLLTDKNKEQVTSSDSHEYVWNDLPKYQVDPMTGRVRIDDKGHFLRYTYQVVELGEDGQPILILNDQGQLPDKGVFIRQIGEDRYEFTYTWTGNMYDGFNLTNSYLIPKTNVSVNKIWVGGPKVKPTITIHLLRDGQAIEKVVLENDTTGYTWKDLDLEFA